MPGFFDIRTLIFVNFLTILILSILMLYILKKHKTYSGFKLFTLAAFFNSIGFILAGSRHFLPLFLSIIIANSIILLSAYMILWSIHSFCCEVRPKKYDFLQLALFVIIFIYFTYVKFSTSNRIITLSLFSVLIEFKLFYYSVKEIKKSLHTVYLPLSISILVMTCSHLLRLGYYLIGNITESDLMAPNIANSMLLIINFCGIILMYTSFIVLNGFRFSMELEQSIINIKTLQGLLPICSHCHKIRDDEGYWEKIDKYMQKNTDIKFTHGLCPDCVKKYYSEYTDSEL